MAGCSFLFSVGGPRAYSQLHGQLDNALPNLKFSNRLTWRGAANLWKQKHRSAAILAARSGPTCEHLCWVGWGSYVEWWCVMV